MNEHPITDAELEGLERAVGGALARGDASGLDLIGEGDISLVLRAGADGEWACKRLPPFPDGSTAGSYAGTMERYVARLREAGVGVIPTELRSLPSGEGGAVLYCVQPVLAAESLAVGLLRRDPGRGPAVLGDIVDAVDAAVGPALGLDGQLSNWAVLDGRLAYFDVTTPFLRGDDGTDALDTRVLLASLPWAARGLVARFVAPRLLDRYHDPRSVVRDLAANLLKEGLGNLVPAVTELAGDRFGEPLTVEEVRRDRRRDRRTWAALQAARRADRAWQRKVRRRPYPFLLPTERPWDDVQ